MSSYYREVQLLVDDCGRLFFERCGEIRPLCVYNAEDDKIGEVCEGPEVEED